jgi:hypothetical protein
MATRKMHQTTVRFGADLWEALEDECAELGVSVAQFVREAALARLMYLAGRRGEPSYEQALERAGAVAFSELEPVARARDRSADEVSESKAFWVQGREARRAQELRDERSRRRLER